MNPSSKAKPCLKRLEFIIRYGNPLVGLTVAFGTGIQKATDPEGTCIFWAGLLFASFLAAFLIYGNWALKKIEEEKESKLTKETIRIFTYLNLLGDRIKTIKPRDKRFVYGIYTELADSFEPDRDMKALLEEGRRLFQ